MENRFSFVFYALNRHSYVSGLSYFKQKKISLSWVLLIKGRDFYTKESDWYDILECYLNGKKLWSGGFYSSSSAVKMLIKSYRVYSYLKKNRFRSSFEVKFVFTNYTDIPTLVAYQNILNVSEVVLVDDGMVVFNTAARRHKSKKPVLKDAVLSKSKFLGLFVKFILKRMGFSYPSIDSITFYSVFPIENRVSRDDRFLRNRVGQDFTNVDVRSGVAHFVSQPILTLNIASEFAFKLAIDQVAKKYKVVTYFPHRHESEKELKIVRKYKNIKIMKDSKPYEEYLKDSKYCPGAIISFYSSVLYTLYDLPKECNLLFVSIPEDHLTTENKDTVLNVFNSLSEDDRFERL